MIDPSSLMPNSAGGSLSGNSSGGMTQLPFQSQQLGDLQASLAQRLNALQRMTTLRSAKMSKQLNEVLHRNELAFYEHTMRRVETDTKSRDAVQSLAGKFSLINTLQQALSS